MSPPSKMHPRANKVLSKLQQPLPTQEKATTRNEAAKAHLNSSSWLPVRSEKAPSAHRRCDKIRAVIATTSGTGQYRALAAGGKRPNCAKVAVASVAVRDMRFIGRMVLRELAVRG